MSYLENEPEVWLWREVIITAIRDASRSINKSTSREVILNKQEAIKFLTDENGKWADSREFVCALAMISEEELKYNYIECVMGRKNVKEVLKKIKRSKKCPVMI